MPALLLVAKNAEAELLLRPGLANRHGLITGATGTDKTVTLQALAALALTYAGIALVMSVRLGGGPEQRLFLLGAALVFGSFTC